MVYRTMGALGLIGSGCTAADLDKFPPGTGNGQKVLVLGAGIAGLTAAYELSKLGFEVKVLEATARAGGRSFTARTGDVLVEEDSEQTCEFGDDPNLYMNMGPARIPHHHDRVLGYCREFGVALEVFTNDNRGAFFHSQAAQRAVPARHLRSDVNGHIAELLAKAVNRGALDQELTQVDREAFLDMLATFGALDGEGAYRGSDRTGFRDQVNAGIADPRTLPLPDVVPLSEILGVPHFRDYRFFFNELLNSNPTLLQPVGGMDRIIDGFMEKVGDLIHYECPIESIETTTDDTGMNLGVIVRYQRDGEVQEETADFAICTIPATVLRDIPNNFRPEVQQELADMKYVQAVKIGVQTSRRFWEEDDQIYGGISWTDQDVMQLWYPANGYHQQKGVLVTAYIWDDAPAETFASRSPGERLAASNMQLDNIHPGASATVENGVSRAWSKVPYQKGSWVTDNQPYTELAQGDGAVVFAGEHLSYLVGWQEGSVLSAQAAVQTIAERIMGA